MFQNESDMKHIGDSLFMSEVLQLENKMLVTWYKGKKRIKMSQCKDN